MTETVELSAEVVRVLTDMRALLQRGWIQGMAANERGVCLLEANHRAAQVLFRSCWHPQARQAQHVLELELGCRGAWELAAWNDAPGRTQEEVLWLLDGILARTRK